MKKIITILVFVFAPLTAFAQSNGRQLDSSSIGWGSYDLANSASTGLQVTNSNIYPVEDAPSCGAHQQLVDGQCRVVITDNPRFECPEGTVLVSGRCKDVHFVGPAIVCPTGFTELDGQCVPYVTNQPYQVPDQASVEEDCGNGWGCKAEELQKQQCADLYARLAAGPGAYTQGQVAEYQAKCQGRWGYP